MTGVGGAAPAWTSANAILTAQSVTIDVHGNAAFSSTCTDAGAARVWQVAATPFSTQAVIRVSTAGTPVTDISASCVTNTYAHDGFARQTAATDGRGNTSRTAHNALGQVEYTENAASNRTAYAYDEFGRQVAVASPLSNTVFTAYDSLGNVIRTWGATYPVEYGYDTRGRKISMKTFRVENGNGDETRWLYDNVSGLLTNKVYADGKGTAYGYTSSGRLDSRTWARGVTTGYAYDALGQLTGIVYSDATPDVAFAYDRLGRMTSATTPVSTNLFEYAGFDLVTETQNGVTVTRSYDSLGRSAGFSMGAAYSADYGYDTFGRFASVSSSVALASSVAAYSYVPGADLVASMTNSSGFLWARVYEQNRDLITRVEHAFAANPVSAYGYANDADGRRTLRIDSTPALSVTNAFDYNIRAEVTNAVMGSSTYGYGYDDIGNRRWAVAGALLNMCSANQLNQYTAVTNAGVSVTVAYDLDGNMTRNGDWHYYWDGENNMVEALPVSATNGSLRVESGYDYMRRRITKTVSVLNGHEPPSGSPPVPGDPGEWVPVRTTKFVWDGMNIAAEIVVDLSADTTNVTRYVWGVDLSGSVQGAGGVGGLLAEIRDDGSMFFPCYDANGNITDYVDVYGSVRGQFEYDAFGAPVAMSGDHADSFHFRFSTKYHDDETGNDVYQQRQSIPPLARWTSRDPIEDLGYVITYAAFTIPGSSPYLFVRNDAANLIDPLGLSEWRLDLTDHGGPHIQLDDYRWDARTLDPIPHKGITPPKLTPSQMKELAKSGILDDLLRKVPNSVVKEAGEELYGAAFAKTGSKCLSKSAQKQLAKSILKKIPVVLLIYATADYADGGFEKALKNAVIPGDLIEDVVKDSSRRYSEWIDAMAKAIWEKRCKCAGLDPKELE